VQQCEQQYVAVQAAVCGSAECATVCDSARQRVTVQQCLCGSAAVCSSACGSVGQCVRVAVCIIVCGSANGNLWQFARQKCAAL
jgi:hypothetical protein